jgi:membrane-associated phospholipid phosphatase
MLPSGPDLSSAHALGHGTRQPARAWLIAWAIVTAILIVFLSFHGTVDQIAWRGTRDAAGKGTWFYRHTENLWLVFKAFGEPWMIAIMAIFLAVHDRRRWIRAGSFVLAVSLAGGLAALMRIIDGRYRPTHIDGGWQWELFRGLRDGRDLAFPSGHATVAFAAAAVFSYLSPKGRYLFGAVAAGTALSRVIEGAHFYSDVLLGAALGWTVGWFAFSLLERIFAGPSRAEVSGPTSSHEPDTGSASS